MLRHLIVLLLFFALFSEGKSQWYIVSTPTSNDLYDVYFADSLHGWINGIIGIYHTLDGGESWIQQSTDGSFVFGGIDSSTCWTAGRKDTLLRTTDAGNNWDKLAIGGYLSLDSVTAITEVHFIDNLHGWISAVGWSGGDSFVLEVVKTRDGGGTWEHDSLSGLSTQSMYAFIQFVDTSIGWVIGNSILRTSDGGTSWDSIYTNFYGGTEDVQMCSSEIGYRIESGPIGINSLWKTIDGGYSWNVIRDFQWSGATHLWFANPDTGWVTHFGGLNGMEIWRTNDGGITWSEQGTPWEFSPRRIFFSDINHGWIVGEQGLSIQTRNGGLTAIEEDQDNFIPRDFVLHQNHPNPFNPATVIRYQLPLRSHVQLRIIDIRGRMLAVLVNSEQPPGHHEVPFNADGLSTGSYFCELLAGSYHSVVKMLYVR